MCIAAATVTVPVALPATLAAQTPTGPMWDSYLKAVTILRTAVAAHGGVDRIDRLSAVGYTWDGREYAPVQGRVPATSADTTGNGRPAMYEYLLDYKNDRFTFNGAFGFGGGFGDITSPMRAAINNHVASDHKKSVSFDPSDPGGFFAGDSTGAVARGTQNRFADMAPLVLIKRAMTSVNSLRYLGAAARGNHTEDAIQFTEGDDRPRVLYFDRASHLLTRTDRLGDGASFGDEIDAVAFSDYRTIDGLQVPGRAEELWNDVLVGRFTLTKFSADQPLAANVLDVPAEFRTVPAGEARGLRITKVRDAVYLVEGIGGAGYRSLAVDTDDGVVVVEAPVSVAASEAAASLIERTLPGRPIKYLVVTHHHGDHRAGIKAYTDRGASVLVATYAVAYIKQRLSDPHTLNHFVPLPPSTAADHIVASPARRTFGHGDARVEIIEIGPTQHSVDMLAAYVPSAKLLFTGDAFFSNSRGVPSPASRELADIVRRQHLEVESLVNVHGLNSTWSDLESAIRRSVP